MVSTSDIEASVIVPTHNRRDLLRRCLQALAEQTQDLSTFEVVVADDGSDDDTAIMLGEFEAPFHLQTLILGSVGQSPARNAGIEASRGRVCILLDDDVISSPSLVQEHLAAHRQHDRMVGIGALVQEPPSARDWYAHAFARAWAQHYSRLEDGPATWADCYGGNMSAPRSALLEVGGFATDISISKDTEIGFRLEQHGYAPRFLPRAHAVHDDQKPCTRLLGDLKRQGSGYIDLVAKHPAMQKKLLGWFAMGSKRELLLRRSLIALRVPPMVLVRAGALLRGQGGQDLWYEFVRKYAFWLAVRQRVSRQSWLELTRAPSPPAPTTPVDAR
jgi:glycosyltransferase involved in cell wall biosynthesis